MRFRLILRLVLIAVIGAGFSYYQYSIRRIPPQVSLDYERLGVSALFAAPFETDGIKHLIPLEDVVNGGVAAHNIPALDDPYYISIVAADNRISDDALGISIIFNDQAYFYPLSILSHHEVVNEQTIVITYSPLTYRPAVYLNDNLKFNASGQLWNNNTLLTDTESESLWSQALGTAVVGELTGKTLEQYPFGLQTWASWRDENSRGQVLSEYTGYERDYTVDAYWNYYETNSIMFPLRWLDSRLAAKSLVFGVRDELNQAKAWSEQKLVSDPLVNDSFSTQPVLIKYDSESLSTRTFLRLVDNQEFHFYTDGNSIFDHETGTEWNQNGLAVSGELAGKQLEELITEPAYWFSWHNTYPDTEIVL